MTWIWEGHLFGEEVGATYDPQRVCDYEEYGMECDYEDKREPCCYILHPGKVMSGKWFQPIESDYYNMNFRFTSGMKLTSFCLKNNKRYRSRTVSETTGAHFLGYGSIILLLESLLFA